MKLQEIGGAIVLNFNGDNERKLIMRKTYESETTYLKTLDKPKTIKK